jgi:uncharacterized protein YggT (Ycf19 family)
VPLQGLFLNLSFLFYLIAKLISIWLSAVLWSMLGRVILQFFLNPEESRIILFLTCISEPFIMPFRAILAKFNLFQNIPLDMPFILAYIVYSTVQVMLPII